MTSALKSLSLVLISLITASSSYAIVGGQIVLNPNDLVAKSTVALYMTNKDGAGSICSGTIMNNEYVLTAAHCVINIQSGVVVFDPSLSAARQTSVRPIYKANFNIDYQLKSFAEQNDVALVRFKGGIPAGYAPAKVLHPSVSLNYVREGQAIVVAGYGITTRGGNNSGTLRKLATTILAVGPQKKHIMIGTDGHVACSGDSGGPAYVVVNGVYYVWGIASLSNCETRSIYIRMTSNMFGTPIVPAFL